MVTVKKEDGSRSFSVCSCSFHELCVQNVVPTIHSLIELSVNCMLGLLANLIKIDW